MTQHAETCKEFPARVISFMAFNSGVMASSSVGVWLLRPNRHVHVSAGRECVLVMAEDLDGFIHVPRREPHVRVSLDVSTCVAPTHHWFTDAIRPRRHHVRPRHAQTAQRWMNAAAVCVSCETSADH